MRRVWRFTPALYSRSLESIREEHGKNWNRTLPLRRIVTGGIDDRSAFTSATVQSSELVSQIESAHRAYREAQLKLAEAMAIDPAKSVLPEAEGELQSFRCGWILIPKQRRLCSEGPISNSRVYSCALLTKINGSSQATFILPLGEI